jgi:L-seryl-tRNA(Ser) seleniumtransferase
MANPQAAETAAALRLLPSTDDLLATGSAKQMLHEAGRRRLTTLARLAIDDLRQELLTEVSSGAQRTETYSKESLLSKAVIRFEDLWRRQKSGRIRKVINATGVVVHTNLGRAPLSRDAIEAIAGAAGYATVEYDLSTGGRGKRGSSVERLLTELTGAEAALVVNNCAAAAFLVLSVFAKGGQTIVSRGELVEIGGDFRIPDVLAQSGSSLVEVGTTNRTKLADYERAIGEGTAVVMRVHPSNYRIVGFTEKPSLSDLAELCRRKGVLLYEDAGSGALIDLTSFGLTDEPLISRSIEEGADLVTFSGDKLLGASQAGIVVGKRDLVERIRKHPLYRALRADKLAYAALEATLESYAREDAAETIPVLRALSIQKNELDIRARDFAERLELRLDGTVIEIADGESVVGGGSAPGVRLPTALIALTHPGRSAEEIEGKLRAGEVPVIARIEDDRVVIDLRTVEPAEESLLLQMVAAALV